MPLRSLGFGRIKFLVSKAVVYSAIKYSYTVLHSLNQISSVNLLEAVNCISVVLDHQSKHASHLLVALEGGKLIIVSVGDPHSHTKS